MIQTGLTQNQRIWCILAQSVRLQTAPTGGVRKSYQKRKSQAQTDLIGKCKRPKELKQVIGISYHAGGMKDIPLQEVITILADAGLRRNRDDVRSRSPYPLR